MQLHRPGDLVRVDVRDCHALDLPLLVEDVDRAPVGEPRDRDLGQPSQRLLVVERRRKQLARLGEERHPCFRDLQRFVEARALECLRGLTREGELQSAAVSVEVLVGREGERQAADRPALDDERQAHERVRPLARRTERGVPLQPVLLGAKEDRFARSHGFRKRKVAGNRKLRPALDQARSVTPLRDDLERLPVLAQQRDQAGARLRRRHALGQDGVQHLRRSDRHRQRLGRMLQPRRGSRGALRGLARLRGVGHVCSSISCRSWSRSPSASRSSICSSLSARWIGSNGLTT